MAIRLAGIVHNGLKQNIDNLHDNYFCEIIKDIVNFKNIFKKSKKEFFSYLKLF